MSSNINIQNKRARFDFEILETFSCGIVLYGTEIKSLRKGKGRITESFCQIIDGELFVVNMYIDEYSHATFYNHSPRRERKLLIQKKQMHKIEKSVKEKGLTLVPLRVFINEKGWAKMDIAIARGKKLYDKRESIKQRETTRDLDRKYKI